MPFEMTKTYQLRTMDFDRWGRIQPAAALDIFQDVAALQADTMGIGYDDMTAKGLFWAVIRVKYEIVAQPTVHQEVVVRTWPYSPSRFSFQRDYTMKDTDGNLLIKATSEWVMMNLATRTFASVKDNYAGPDDYSEDRCFPKKARKVRDFDAVGEGTIVMPSYSDVDVNGHVNNAHYATYMMDAANPSENAAIRVFQIDYRYEVQEGQPLHMFLREDEDALVGKGINADGQTAFLCKIER